MIGNSSTAKVLGKGRVDLKLTSTKILALHNMQHIPDVNKNLISDFLLNKHGYKLVFESKRVVISLNRNFIGKGYAYGGLFKCVAHSNNELNNITSSFVSIFHSTFLSCDT